MSNARKAIIIVIAVLIALASVGCEVNESAGTILDAGEAVAEIGTVYSLLKGLADQDYQR